MTVSMHEISWNLTEEVEADYLQKGKSQAECETFYIILHRKETLDTGLYLDREWDQGHSSWGKDLFWVEISQ